MRPRLRYTLSIRHTYLYARLHNHEKEAQDEGFSHRSVRACNPVRDWGAVGVDDWELRGRRDVVAVHHLYRGSAARGGGAGGAGRNHARRAVRARAAAD